MPKGAQDGTATILVADPVTGGFSQMINALTYGALGNGSLALAARLGAGHAGRSAGSESDPRPRRCGRRSYRCERGHDCLERDQRIAVFDMRRNFFLFGAER